MHDPPLALDVEATIEWLDRHREGIGRLSLIGRYNVPGRKRCACSGDPWCGTLWAWRHERWSRFLQVSQRPSSAVCFVDQQQERIIVCQSSSRDPPRGETMREDLLSHRRSADFACPFRKISLPLRWLDGCLVLVVFFCLSFFLPSSLLGRPRRKEGKSQRCGGSSYLVALVGANGQTGASGSFLGHLDGLMGVDAVVYGG